MVPLTYSFIPSKLNERLIGFKLTREILDDHDIFVILYYNTNNLNKSIFWSIYLFIVVLLSLRVV